MIFKKKKCAYTHENLKLDLDNLAGLIDTKIVGLSIYGHSTENIVETINLGIELYLKLKKSSSKSVDLCGNKSLTLHKNTLKLEQN